MGESTQNEAEILDKVKAEIEGSGYKIKKFQGLSDPVKKEILENFDLKLFYAIKTTFPKFRWPKHFTEIVKYNQRGKRTERGFLFADDKEIALAEKYTPTLTMWQVQNLILIKRALKSGISDYNYFDDDLKEGILKNKSEEFIKIIRKEFPDVKISIEV